MRPETRQNLADARAAAEEARVLAAGAWQESRITSLAVERLLMIVGQAFVRTRWSEPAVLDEIADAYKVIGMRNVLVHGYDALDPARIRDAVEKSLPALIAELDALLGAEIDA
ncbi:MAG: DUF86 domain-containing protein [Chthonomonadales bacterium]|nr:DUF86 domain-containing protein [Chthonomonadales bacterium]